MSGLREFNFLAHPGFRPSDSTLGCGYIVAPPLGNRTQLERQIAGVDREIDRLVYQLYGLNESEIKIVEGTN